MTEKHTNNGSDDDNEQQKRLTQRFVGASLQHFSQEAADAIDLFKISKKTEINTLPKDAIVEIHTTDRPPINLYHDPEGNYDLLSEGKEGTVNRLPVKIIGSSATPSSLFEVGTITQDGYFHYGIKYKFKTGQDEGVPDRYKLFEDPSTLDPTILQENLKMGIIVRGEDGSLLWQVVDEQPPVGPVTSVVVMHEHGLDQAL